MVFFLQCDLSALSNSLFIIQCEDDEMRMNELTRKADTLQQGVTDERKREEIRKKQQMLQAKFNILKV